jgi:hypothetical protein
VKKLLNFTRDTLKKIMPFALIICIIYILCINDYRKQEKLQIDNSFTNELNVARAMFSNDYGNNDEEGKVYLRTNTAASLYSSVSLFKHTSYSNNKDRNDLFYSIYNLYLCMSRSEASRVIFTKYNKEVSQYLLRLANDPNDKEAYEALDELTYKVLNSK